MPKLHLAWESAEETVHAFRCPGCDDSHEIRTRGPHAWGWNGSLDRPTLRPSILVHSHGTLDDAGKYAKTPRCHSFVTGGRIASPRRLRSPACRADGRAAGVGMRRPVTSRPVRSPCSRAGLDSDRVR